ncbi:MAG: hypothetical protein AB7O74_02820 [Candidatus Nanopelagicales bacterium]
MRHDSKARTTQRPTPAAAERARIRRLTAEGQRLRVNDEARDHFAQPGAEQATTVARRTLASWR